MSFLSKLGFKVDVSDAPVLVKIEGFTPEETQDFIKDNLSIPGKTIKTRRIVSETLFKTEFCDINIFRGE